MRIWNWLRNLSGGCFVLLALALLLLCGGTMFFASQSINQPNGAVVFATETPVEQVPTSDPLLNVTPPFRAAGVTQQPAQATLDPAAAFGQLLGTGTSTITAQQLLTTTAVPQVIPTQQLSQVPQMWNVFIVYGKEWSVATQSNPDPQDDRRAVRESIGSTAFQNTARIWLEVEDLHVLDRYSGDWSSAEFEIWHPENISVSGKVSIGQIIGFPADSGFIAWAQVPWSNVVAQYVSTQNSVYLSYGYEPRSPEFSIFFRECLRLCTGFFLPQPADLGVTPRGPLGWYGIHVSDTSRNGSCQLAPQAFVPSVWYSNAAECGRREVDLDVINPQQPAGSPTPPPATDEAALMAAPMLTAGQWDFITASNWENVQFALRGTRERGLLIIGPNLSQGRQAPLDVAGLMQYTGQIEIIARGYTLGSTELFEVMTRECSDGTCVIVTYPAADSAPFPISGMQVFLEHLRDDKFMNGTCQDSGVALAQVNFVALLNRCGQTPTPLPSISAPTATLHPSLMGTAAP